MSDWSAGYVAEIPYTFGYYTELNPLRIQLAFLNNRLAYPECGTACELGFGQGLSANIHAAASIIQWYGTDFSPVQASFAQELSRASGNDAKLFDDSFGDFIKRPDLPEFDYIGLHGIWSWVSDENRELIVEFIQRKLKVGGVVYISYNTLPGWAAFAPMRHLITEHATVLGSEGSGIVKRVDDAINFASSLLATNPIFSSANPQVQDRIEKLKTQNRPYLAHEYFNKDWHPMHFATMAEWLEPAKLQYACSANYLDLVDPINLTVEQKKFLDDIPDIMFRESVRDFMVNQQFRRDYWVKGLRRLSAIEQSELLQATTVVLLAPRQSVPLHVNSALGKSEMSASVYDPILDSLADHRPKSIGQIRTELKDRNIPLAQIVQALIVLIGAGHVTSAQTEVVSPKVKKQTEKLNSFIVQKSRGSGDITFLASPVTGGGVVVSRFNQLFLLAINKGNKLPEQWAKFAWDNLALMGEKIVSEGKILETTQENVDYLSKLAIEFAENQLPILKALHVA